MLNAVGQTPGAMACRLNSGSSSAGRARPGTSASGRSGRPSPSVSAGVSWWSPASTTSQASPLAGSNVASCKLTAAEETRVPNGSPLGKSDERSKVCASAPLTNTRASVTGIQGAAATEIFRVAVGLTVMGAMSGR